MTPEGKVQKKIISYALERGCLVKRNYMGRGAERGWPDLEIFCPNGVVLLMEVKAPGNTPTKLQAHRLRTLRELGHKAGWVDSFEEAKIQIDVYSSR